MLRSLQLLLLLCLCGTAISAQTSAPANISIGTLDSFYSGTLGEQRKLMVYLPANYNAKKRYPVCYLLDAETHFHMFTGIVKHLSNYAIPEMIVVGIVNINRGKDYPPSHDAGSPDTANGHGEAYTTFIEKELIPYIDRSYASAPYRILAGHSLGGLMAVNTLIHHTAVFKAYIAVDPSLWWDNMKLVRQSGAALQARPWPDIRLFIGLSGQFPSDEKAADVLLTDTSARSRDVRSVLLFKRSLPAMDRAGLRWTSKGYPDEIHGSVPLPAYYDGLHFVFDFYKRPSLNVLTDTSVQMLERHYQQVSKQMGFTMLPPEEELSGLAWRSAVLEDNLDRAYLYLQTYLRLYPASPDAYTSMGEYYEAKGDLKKAGKYYDRAKALSDHSK